MGFKFDERTNTWTAYYSMRHPKTRVPKKLLRKNLKSAADAKRVEAELIFEIKKSFEGLPPGAIVYSDLLRRFETSLVERDLSRLTIDNYLTCLHKHTKGWGSRTIGSISTDEIRNLIKIRLCEISPQQQKNVLKYIRGVFTFAVESEFLIRNPVPKMTFRTGDKIKRVLTFQQAKLLLEKALNYSHDWYPIWVTALYTGMRNGELYALTWDKIDFENRTILVSGTWNKKDGQKDLTKSGEDRIVEIATDLMTVLKELKLKSDGNPYVLPRLQDWETGRQAEILRMFLASIGLPRIRFHDLRASWATMLLGRGLEPAKVMKLGGWKDLKTMMIYLRKAGIDTRGTLENFSIHDASQRGSVLEFKPAGL